MEAYGYAQSRATGAQFDSCQYSLTYVKTAANVPAVDRAHPRTAVIGAGISGLTAGKMLKDYGESARHTQQVDYFHYEHDIRTREMPAGIKRAGRLAPV